MTGSCLNPAEFCDTLPGMRRDATKLTRSSICLAGLGIAATALVPSQASATGSSNAGPSTLTITAFDYAMTTGGTPPAAYHSWQGQAVQYTPPAAPTENTPCIDTTNVWAGMPPGIRAGNDQGTTNYMIKVVPTLTPDGSGGYTGTVSVTVPTAYDHGAYSYTTLTGNIQPIVGVSTAEQQASGQIASAYNTSFQSSVAGIPFIGGILSTFSPYSASDFPITYDSTPTAGAVAYAGDLPTWGTEVDVYLTGPGNWTFAVGDQQHTYQSGSTPPPAGSPPGTQPTPVYTTVTVHGLNSAPDGWKIPGQHYVCSNPPQIANVDIPTLVANSPAVPGSPGAPAALSPIAMTNAINQFTKPAPLPTYPAPVNGQVQSYIRMPTYSWIPTGAAPGGGWYFPQTPIVLAAPVVTLPGVGGPLGGALTVTEYFKATLLPATGPTPGITWNFNDPSGDKSGGHSGIGQAPAHQPCFDPAGGNWSAGGTTGHCDGQSPGNLDNVYHEYQVVDQSGNIRITVDEEFTVVVQGVFNNGVSAGVQPVPGCSGSAYGLADVCSVTTVPEHWESDPVIVNQIQGVPYTG